MTISKNVSSSSSKVRIVAPYELTRTLRLKPADAGQNLIEFLCTRFPYIPQQTWEKRVKNGWLVMDNKPLGLETILTGHGAIHHYNPRVSEPSVPDSVEIIEETSNWLIINKPAPMPMHQGGRYYKNTLLHVLKEMGHHNLKTVHRLDAVTSGMVLFAKNRVTALTFQSMFSRNKVVKWYYALVKGEMNDSHKIVEAPIRRKKGFVFECGKGLTSAKEAVTKIYRVETGEGVTLVKCVPVTGRTHQIRLHLNYAGLPIVDDPIYGPGGDMSGNRLQHTSIKLRSSALYFPELGFRKELPVPREWIKAPAQLLQK